MDTKQTAVSLDQNELLALVELFRIAQPRLTTAEQLFFNSLFGRFDDELRVQQADQYNAAQMMREAMEQPQPGFEKPHLGPPAPMPDLTPPEYPIINDENPDERPAYGDGH